MSYFCTEAIGCIHPQHDLLEDLREIKENISAKKWSLCLLLLQKCEKKALTYRDFPLVIWTMATWTEIAYQYFPDLLEPAHGKAQETLMFCRETGDVTTEAYMLKILASIAFDQGRSKDGHDHLLDAMALFDDLQKPHEVALLTRWYGEHLAILGAFSEAEHALLLAKKRYIHLKDSLAARSCDLDLGQIRQMK